MYLSTFMAIISGVYIVVFVALDMNIEEDPKAFLLMAIFALAFSLIGIAIRFKGRDIRIL